MPKDKNKHDQHTASKANRCGNYRWWYRGVSAAWHLAVAGYRVLCEKGIIGGEQTGRNWGWCRKTLRDPKEIPLMQQSARDWQDKRYLQP